MYQFLVESILGLLTGLFLGITGIAPTGIVLLVLDYLNIGDYKTNLGTVLFLNLFPISIGSVYQFYKSKQINFSVGFILLVSLTLGGFIGSKFVAGDKKLTFSAKQIKYITAFLSFITGIFFLISAYYDKSTN
jgi:uncharacterized membrane protein YfcA